MAEPVTLDSDHLRILLRAASGASCDLERLRAAQRATEEAMPKCGAEGPLYFEELDLSGRSGIFTCQSYPHDAGRHHASGEVKGHKWELWWEPAEIPAPARFSPFALEDACDADD